jgi:hypothetical protein
MNTKPIIYIAGPISGYPDLNKPAFSEMANELLQCGFEVKNPHEFCADIKTDNSSDPAYYKRGFIELTTCTDIILLNGWQYSKGAQIERQAAILFRQGIFESAEDLIRKYSNS